MAYTFDYLDARDPSNPTVRAANASITLFAPGDATKTPVTLTTVDGQPYPNPVTTNADGYAPQPVSATLDQIAWAGGGFEGTMIAYEGIKNEAVKARTAADNSAAAAASAQASATQARTEAQNAQAAAEDAAALVGAPADTVIAAAINNPATDTHAALTKYARKDRIYLADYLATTRTPGTTDDTSAFLAARTAAAGTTLVIAPGRYKVSDVVEFTTDNVTVEAHGAIIDLVDDGTGTGRIFRAINCGNFAWLGGRLTQTAASRTGVYGLLTLDNVTGALVDGLHTIGGSSTGLWAAAGRDHRYRSVTVHDSKADGIHISRGITDVDIESGHFRNTGDDAIGVVSVLADGQVTYGQIKRVSVRNPIVDGTTLGGGVAFVGCSDSELVGGIIHGTDDAGVKITNDTVAGATLASSFITITGTQVRGSQDGYRLGVAEDCVLNGVTAVSNADTGLSLLGATRTHVSGGKFRGNASFGIYESSGTGNRINDADLRGNTTNTHQVATAVLTDCVLA